MVFGTIWSDAVLNCLFPSGYPMIVSSLRSCLAGLPTRKTTAEVGQLLRWSRVRADGERPKAASDTDGLHRRPWPVFPLLQHFFARQKDCHSSKWTSPIAADFPPL